MQAGIEFLVCLRYLCRLPSSPPGLMQCSQNPKGFGLSAGKCCDGNSTAVAGVAGTNHCGVEVVGQLASSCVCCVCLSSVGTVESFGGPFFPPLLEPHDGMLSCRAALRCAVLCRTLISWVGRGGMPHAVLLSFGHTCGYTLLCVMCVRVAQTRLHCPRCVLTHRQTMGGSRRH